MIADRLENAGVYAGLGQSITKGLALLGEDAVRSSPPGRYELDGDNMFYISDGYKTQHAESGRFEAHRRYIDIQFVTEGREWIAVRNIDNLRVQRPYDVQKDIEFYHLQQPFSRIAMEPGSFAIFWPHDAHMPGRMFDGPETIKKIVIKIRLDQPSTF